MLAWSMKSRFAINLIEKWSYDYIKMDCKDGKCYGVLAVCATLHVLSVVPDVLFYRCTASVSRCRYSTSCSAYCLSESSILETRGLLFRMGMSLYCDPTDRCVDQESLDGGVRKCWPGLPWLWSRSSYRTDSSWSGGTTSPCSVPHCSFCLALSFSWTSPTHGRRCVSRTGRIRQTPTYGNGFSLVPRVGCTPLPSH